MRTVLTSLALLAPLVAQGPSPERGRTADHATAAVRELRDVAYVGDGAAAATEPKQRLDLYLPPVPATGKVPLVMFVHGGGWRFGDRAPYQPLGRLFAANGIGCAVISYRLSPAAAHPAQVEDCAAALRWLVAHGADLGCDARHIVLCGHSAGAHLVALLATDRARCGDAAGAIAGVVPISGPYDVTAPLPLFVEVFGKDAGDRRDASPIAHVDGGAPPFLVLWGSDDMPGLPALARMFAARLRRAEVPVEAVEVAGRNHHSILAGFATPAGDEVTQRIVAFVKTRVAAATAR